MKNYIIPSTGEIKSYEDGLTLTDIKKLPNVPNTIKAYSGAIPDETYDYVNNVWVQDPAKLATKVLADKWVQVAEFQASQTVTITPSGNKFAVNKEALASMALKRDALAADGVSMWYESWGSFQTDKAELQEAITQADTDLQAKIDELFGAV